MNIEDKLKMHSWKQRRVIVDVQTVKSYKIVAAVSGVQRDCMQLGTWNNNNK